MSTLLSAVSDQFRPAVDYAVAHPVAALSVASIASYYTYILFISKAAFDGSGESMWFRRHGIHKRFVDSINGRIIVDEAGKKINKTSSPVSSNEGGKEAEAAAANDNNTFLDSSKQYVFGLSPHHVASIHHHLFFSNGAGFLDKIYSGPKRSAVASILLQTPILREYFLSVGCVDASRPTFDRMLRKGYSMLVLPGGIAEQLRSEFGKEKVLLRKGFVRIAMENNVGLVPCYCFGESHLYYTSNFMSKFRRFLAEKFYIGISLFWGPKWWCPFIPRNDVPLVVVIGAPLDPRAIVAEAVAQGRLTAEEGEAGFQKPPKGYHQRLKKQKKGGADKNEPKPVTAVDIVFEKYVEELKRIFETYKAEAGYPNAVLELL